MKSEDITGGLDLLGDWLDAKGYGEEAGLCTKAMDELTRTNKNYGELSKEVETLRAENARLLKKNTALKAALEETYKIASRNEDGEYKWQVIKALSEEDYE